jgi:hypothetical protein
LFSVDEGTTRAIHLAEVVYLIFELIGWAVCRAHCIVEVVVVGVGRLTGVAICVGGVEAGLALGCTLQAFK